MLQDQHEYPCETCGRFAAECICPECPVCHEVGNRFCYDEGYLTYSQEQIIGQAKLDVAKAKEDLQEAEYWLQWVTEKGAEI